MSQPSKKLSFLKPSAPVQKQDAPAWNILIVDDEEYVHEVTRLVLKDAVFDGRPLALHSARSANEARAYLRTEHDIAMILLDVVMETESAGLDLIPFIRRTIGNLAVRIVLRTGQPGQFSERQAFVEHDIHDYAQKTELTANKLFTMVLSSLRAYRDIRLTEWKALKTYSSRVERELTSARAMQSELTPSPHMVKELAAAAGLDIAIHEEPSSELGGDTWSLFDLGEGLVGVLVADFSGHGVAAAINVFRLHILFTRHPPNRVDPGAWLAEINQELCGILPLGQFAAMFFGVIDPKNDRLMYAACGGPNPMLVSTDGVKMLDASGVPLGLDADSTYETRSEIFSAGTGVLMYSDALIESKGEDAPPLNHEGVEALCQTFGHGPRPPIAILLEDGLAARRPIQDDLTLLWVARPPARVA